MTYRLAIDMGATSIGWCVLTLHDHGKISDIRDMGVRIFPDGRNAKNKEPLTVSRRGARSAARRRDRYLSRRDRLMDLMIEHGLMPQTKLERKVLELKNPYELRDRAARREVTLHELGRALFHINQRRGFKSNRKADSKIKESGAIKKGVTDLEAAIKASDAETLGQFLYSKLKKKETVLARAALKKSQSEYEFYPSRKMYENEVDFILEIQKKFHTEELTNDFCANLKDIIFYQRPLKKPLFGQCTLETETKEKRARLASPTVQYFRILQEVNNLEIDQFEGTDPCLTQKDREKLVNALQNKKEMTFTAIRKLLGLSNDRQFNLEAGNNRKKLNGNTTNFYLSKKDYFGDIWHTLATEQKEKIAECLMSEACSKTVVEELVKDYDISVEQAQKICDSPLKEGYGRVSLKAIEKILPGLEKGLKYSAACEKAGYHHSDFRTDEILKELPYYGKILESSVIGGSYSPKDKNDPEKYYGKINNPTVHIALNQLRKLVNALLDIHGPPSEIAIELARELKYGQKRLDEHNKKQKKNQERNENINTKLKELNVPQNYKNRLKYKLWEELASDPIKRYCPFTGKQISSCDIFFDKFEIEHLLPFSLSYNDSPANKVLSCKNANRIKGNQSPYEAFGHKPEWKNILARVENLPSNKRWRFKEEAWDIAKGENEDLIARQLTDTQYMTRIAQKYLFGIVQQQGERRVYGIPGQLTALIRRKWGLNTVFDDEIFDNKPKKDDDSKKKDRNNHRHHAIDAFVVGCTTRSMLKDVSQATENERNKIIIPEPFGDFRHELLQKGKNIVISYKPDHGNARQAIQQRKTVAELHKETAYGLVKTEKTKKSIKTTYVTRKPISSFNTCKHIEAVADPVWRKKLLSAVFGYKDESKDFKAALLRISEQENVRRLRVHYIPDSKVMIPVCQKGEIEPYKYYASGGNYCAEIYEIKHGKQAETWKMEIITNYHAHQKGFIPQWQRNYPTAKKIMSLQINDMVAYDENGERKICRLKKMSSGRVYLRDHRIAKEEKDDLSWAASPTQLKKKNARKISVDITGRVKDPKFMKNQDSAA